MANMKEMQIWLCWNYEDQNGKKTKVPYSASGVKCGTSANYKPLWTTYEVAERTKEEHGFDGIGFVIPEGYVFIDIDHKDADDPLVKKILARCESYAEISPSGTGIHVICKADISKIPTWTDNKGRKRLDRQFYIKNPKNGMEIYIGGLTNRFATFTGNNINEYPVVNCTQALLVTLDKDMRRKPKKQYSPQRDGGNESDLEDFDLVNALRKQKNGEKFIRLFDDGDTDDYGSWSEADVALCAMLAFRCGNDPERIDRLFRQSALYREKWEREDYSEQTIQAGIEACHGTFHESVMEHPAFIVYDRKGNPHVSVPLLAKYVKEHLFYILVRDSGKQGVRIYVYKHGVYVLYSQDMMEAEIKRFIEDFDIELVNIRELPLVYKHLITDMDYVSEDALDADESIINFQNGLLRVTPESLTFLPHSPDVYSTIQIPCDWTGVPSPTPVFDNYLNTLTNGNTDTKFLLLEWIGAVLSNIPGYRAKKSLFLVGKGDSGKSQIKALVERIIGKGNYIGIDLKTIEARFGTGAIYGTRLAGSSDMSFLSISELKTFKCLTGGDSVAAEFKGQPLFEYTYKGYLWFCMNKLPRFGGDDDGQWVYDRIMVVDCPNVIPKEKQDGKIMDKMYEERSGIIYSAVKALQTFIADGNRFTEPESVVNARDDYMADNSTVVGFFNDCMRERPAGMRTGELITASVIYRAYCDWCRTENTGYSKPAKDFRDSLCSYLGGTYQDMTFHSEKGTCYKDWTLTEEAAQMYTFCGT